MSAILRGMPCQDMGGIQSRKYHPNLPQIGRFLSPHPLYGNILLCLSYLM